MLLTSRAAARPPPARRDWAMSHYRGNLRDIEFTLFEVLGRQDVLGTAPYAEVDDGRRPRDAPRGGPAGRARAGRVVRRR